jgi:hypothetical protein
MQPILTQKDKEDFWIRLYLGSNKDLIESSIDKAYLDFSRTLHGITKLKTIESWSLIKNTVRSIVNQAIEKDFFSQEEFDEWHKRSCDDLINYCKKTINFTMFYGQAQKWINMSLKYLFALGNERVAGVERNYKYFHIPIDRIIQEMLKSDITSFPISWSRIDCYEDYLDYQKKIRMKFIDRIPLEVEFLLFNKLK